MKRLLSVSSSCCLGAILLSAACTSSTTTPGSGGSSGGRAGQGSGGTLASGGRGTAGAGGNAGAGGTSVGSGGRGSGGDSGLGGSSAAGNGGSLVGSGGQSRGGSAGSDGGGATGSGGFIGAGGGAGNGGAMVGSGGRASGGAAGSSLAGSGGNSGGRGAGGASGGSSGAGGATAVAGDDYVSDVKVAVHANTNTILVVTWTQLKAADKTLLEFSFAGSSVMTSRALAGTTGSHRDVVLGVPEKTAVTVRIVSQVGSVDYKTKDYQGTTLAIPSGMPKPTLVSYDVKLASADRYLFGSVEDSTSGFTDQPVDYVNPFWIYILDRQGRIVWYWVDPSNGASHAFPRVARDGEYIVIDTGRSGETTTPTGVLNMTLDRQYYKFVAIPGIDDAIDVTSDGAVLYDANRELREMDKQGAVRTIWKCPFTDCYCNAVNWVSEDDTVLLSFPDPCTVVRIDRKTGALVAQYGNASGSYAFADATWKFRFQHGPTITPQGTFLLSAHLPDFPYGTPAAEYHHAFEEFDIDVANKKLTMKWIYKEGKEWAESKGMALRLANGNTLVNYGNGGLIREVTTDKKTAFEIKFDSPIGSDFHNNMVGNNVFVDDLYALNGGGPK